MKEKILFESFLKKEGLHYRLYPEMMESLKTIIINSFTVEVEVDMYGLIGNTIEETLLVLRTRQERGDSPDILHVTNDEFNKMVNLSFIYALMMLIARTSQEAQMQERIISELVSNTTQCIMSYLSLSDRDHMFYLDRIRIYKMRLGLL